MELIVNERFDGNKAAFAKAIGLCSTGLSNYLGRQRRSRPSVDMIVNIVRSTGVSYAWLLTGDGSMTVSATLGHSSVTSTEIYAKTLEADVKLKLRKLGK